MPTIDLPDDELAAVIAAIRRAIADDKFPHAPRLDQLRAALARFDAAQVAKDISLSKKVCPKCGEVKRSRCKRSAKLGAATGAISQRSRPLVAK